MDGREWNAAPQLKNPSGVGQRGFEYNYAGCGRLVLKSEPSVEINSSVAGAAAAARATEAAKVAC